jgi:hypothetical protein
MKTLVACALLLSIGAILPRESFAQGMDVGISGVALASIQPRDDTYIGGPYLNEGLGGIGPGVGAGISVITPSGFVASGEFTTARFERQQYGRLVGGSGINEGIAHTSRLHDSLLSALFGYAKSADRTRVLFLGGISVRLDEPTVDHVTRDSGASPAAVTGGIDVLRMLGERTTLVVGGRYSAVSRKHLASLGVGPHVLRIAAGIRVRVN